MEWFAAPDYWFGRLVCQRLIAALYLTGFLAAANQFRALIGEHGMLPVPRFTARVPLRRSPSLFHLYYSDRAFAAVCWTGAALAASVLAGAADHVPLGVAMAGWGVLWLLYLSIVNVGQTWYSFGWESLLLEAGFLAAFLGNARTTPPVLVLWLLRWLLFRVEFGAGLIKLRGDSCWRDLTCLRYHHETQPMPGPLSWFFHHLPGPLHRAEVAANHFVQLVVPVALFLPQPVAGLAAAAMIATQLWLVASGNFAWLNWLTIALAVSVVDAPSAAAVLPVPGRPGFAATPLWYEVMVLLLTVLVAVLSYWPARNLLSRRQAMNRSFNRIHLVNAYGAFGSVNRIRLEVVIEGSAEPARAGGSAGRAVGSAGRAGDGGGDGDGGGSGHAGHTVWHEYGFKGKPGELRRIPRQVAPYHLRLDWLMWFAAISPEYARPWFSAFLARLLANDPATLRLLRHNPFPHKPPVRVRVLLYHYRFTTPRELRATGAWWERTLVREYLAPVTLRDLAHLGPHRAVRSRP
ncbi:lipase maturation factor family protein [Kitasatospora kazusensis]|uniref:lipase maturation factor family protein n=1 Tax=Kitasatospora kazusensis TaxID=407974 RepID=UPI0031DD4003